MTEPIPYQEWERNPTVHGSYDGSVKGVGKLVDSFIVGLSAGAVLGSGHGSAIVAISAACFGFVNAYCASRAQKVQY